MVDKLNVLWYTVLVILRRCGGMADTKDLKSFARKCVPVQVRSAALIELLK